MSIKKRLEYLQHKQRCRLEELRANPSTDNSVKVRTVLNVFFAIVFVIGVLGLLILYASGG